VCFNAKASQRKDNFGKFAGTTVVARDITHRKRSEIALRHNEEKIRSIVDTAVEGIITISERGIIESINQAAEAIFGYSSEQALGRNIKFLMPEPYHNEHDGYLENYLRTGQAKIIGIGREVTGLRKDGSTFPMSLSVSEVGLGEQRIFTGIVQDITERKRLQAELIHLATTDPLTGASNRGHFMERAQEELARSQRYNHPFAFLLMDIDHFKSVNDSYGHPAGDEALRALTRTCLSTLRETDIFGRFGGEEFAAILVESDPESAHQVAERIRQNLASLDVEDDNQTFRFTVSIGLTCVENGEPDLEKIMKSADVALYEAKRSGRNCVVQKLT